MEANIYTCEIIANSIAIFTIFSTSFIITIIVTTIIAVNITAIIIVVAGRECVEAAIYTCQVITIGLFPLPCPSVQ